MCIRDSIKIVALTDDASQVAIPVRKGDDSATLLAAINEAIEELRADGTLTALSEKYFGSDISGATSDAEETAEPAGETAEEAADATGEAVPAEETEPAGEAG